MAQSSAKPEFQADRLPPSQSKAKRLIEELTESAAGEKATEESNIAKEFLQGIWHGNAIPSTPRQKKTKKSQKPVADNEEPDSA